MPTSEMDSRLRVALIGMGAGAEKIMLPGLTGLPSIQLVAACDLDAGIRQRAAERWHIRSVYSTPTEMLAAEKPDLVVVSTPPQTHFDMSMLALENNAHLFCEKPFMTSMANAEQVLAKAQQCKRFVGVNSQYYQMPIYRRIQAEIDNGNPGRLFEIDAWQHMYLLPNEEGGWKAALQPHRVVLEFGTHTVDLICRYFDSLPQAVTARVARVRPDIDADVCINVRLDFSGERFANVLFNRMSYAPMRYFEMRLNCEKAALRASLGGLARFELGLNRKRPDLRVSYTKGGEARIEKDGSSKLLAKQPDSAYGDAAAKHFSTFFDAVKQNQDAISWANRARDILRVLFAIYESAESGGELVKL